MAFGDDSIIEEWSDLISEGMTNQNDHCMRSCRPLLNTCASQITFLGWKQSLLPKLKALIADHKKAVQRNQDIHREKSMMDWFNQLKSQISGRYILPTYNEFILFPQISELMTNNIPLTLQRLKEFVAEFTLVVHKEFVQLAVEEIGEGHLTNVSEHRKLLERADILFPCSTCSNLFSYRGLVQHQSDCGPSGTESRTTFEMLKSVRVKPRTSVVARHVLEFLHLSQHSTHATVERLEVEKRLLCSCGHPNFKNPTTFTGLVSEPVKISLSFLAI